MPAAEDNRQAGSSFLLSNPDLFSGIWVPCLREPVFPEGTQVQWVAGLFCGHTEVGMEGSEPPLLRRRGEAGCSQAQTHRHKG